MNTEDYHSVTIVIVNWNRSDCVVRLLDSLRYYDQNGLNIIVVDNASTDGSQNAIRQHPLPVILLENSENLGGTGGFNSGIRFALDQLKQEYIWLLDNDAEVTPSTLQELIRVMQEDRSIGVAGSCIMSPENHSLIVEAGGVVESATGTWRSHRRYEAYETVTCRVEDVDYVPICSALIRMSVFHQVGILDQRFFLHWDDIDFCTRAKSAGHRVVAALDSPVYHGAEKGHSRMTLYYDFRNALLFFSKRGGGMHLLRPISAQLSRNLISSVYFFLTGHNRISAYLRQGLTDFLKGRFGRVTITPGSLDQEPGGEVIELRNCLTGIKNIVVFAAGSYDEVMVTVRSLKQAAPQLSVCLAVASDRAEVYRVTDVDRLITFDLFRDGLARKMLTAASIFTSRFDLGVSAGTAFAVPYAYLVRRNLVFDAQRGTCSSSDTSLRSSWKLPLAMLMGYLLALVFLVPVMLAARKYKDRPI